MHMLLLFIYHFAIRLYEVSVRVAAKFEHNKAKQRIKLVNNTSFHFSNIAQTKNNRAWLHAASAGEWIQLSPLARQMQADGWNIVVSFYSPSALPFVKREPYPYFVLPFDKRQIFNEVIQSIGPDVFITSRRELWPFLLQTLKKNQIPAVLLNVFIPSNLSCIKQWWWHFMSPFISLACCIDEDSTLKMKKWGAGIAVKTGDTKYDQPEQTLDDQTLIDFLSGRDIVILGSAHSTELEWMAGFIRKHAADFPSFHWIIVPHEPHDDGYHSWKTNTGLPAGIYDGQLSCNSENILYINKVGILAALYAYSRIAIVGGGWTSGTHNAVEPALYGNAIILGPHIEAFREATGLVENGGAKIACNKEELEASLLHWLQDESDCLKTGGFARNYALSMRGSSSKCYSEIKMLL